MVRRQAKMKKKYLGTRRHGAGNAKNRRGSGNRGGKGFAGSGKHKWFQIIKHYPGHFGGGRHGFKPVRKKLREISLREVTNVGRINEMANAGELAKREGKMFFDFDGKILGGGEIKLPVVVKAVFFSESAKKKIESAGGTAIGLVTGGAEAAAATTVKGA